jgi:hypothetical protein
MNRAEKIAALLFALLFAYALKSTIIDYPTEPKVIGGVDLDGQIPKAGPWTPIYFPMLLSAAFAYWIWPKKFHQSLALKLVHGCFSLVVIAYFTLFASFLCANSGGYYSAIPFLTKMEILFGPIGVLLAAFAETAVFGVFFSMAFVLISTIAGCLIVLVSCSVGKCIAWASSAVSGKPAQLTSSERESV